MTKTVSLETAKALKEAGWKPEDTFWFYHPRQNGFLVDSHYWSGTSPNSDFIAAPDVSELLEALPDHIELEQIWFWLELSKTKRKWFAGYYSVDDNPHVVEEKDTPAEALAALWLELRKRKLL